MSDDFYQSGSRTPTKSEKRAIEREVRKLAEEVCTWDVSLACPRPKGTNPDCSTECPGPIAREPEPPKRFTLADAIRRAEEKGSKGDGPCAADHRKLAGWLRAHRADRRKLRALEKKLRPYTEPTNLRMTPFEVGQRAAYANVWKELKVIL